MHWIDPASLPSIEGRIAAFTRNPKGDIDGVLLTDDRQIHIPPHLGVQAETLFEPGDAIEARCVKPRRGDVHVAVQVATASGRILVDDGPAHVARPETKKPARSPIDVAGRVRRTLYAPRGEVAGAVLESGEQLRVEPGSNAELAPFLTAGAEVRVWGDGFRAGETTVIDVGEIGFSQDFEGLDSSTRR